MPRLAPVTIATFPSSRTPCIMRPRAPKRATARAEGPILEGGMPPRKAVNIAIVGTGFIAETRSRCYAGVSGYEPRLVAAVSRTRERLEDYARRNNIPDVYTELDPVLERRDVDVIDLCVPNHLHRPMT